MTLQSNTPTACDTTVESPTVFDITVESPTDFDNTSKFPQTLLNSMTVLTLLLVRSVLTQFPSRRLHHLAICGFPVTSTALLAICG